ncbi:MAG: DUF456 domain-containing protein [Candidatus Nanopelagicales bacterium]
MVLNVLVGLTCVVGIIGTIVPFLPGTLLCAIAIGIWAVMTGGYGWWVGAAALLILGIAVVLKYLIPGRSLRNQGVPALVLIAGGVGGVIGFFVIPIVGVVIGFVAGIYLAELIRLQSVGQAWPTTVAAMKAAGISMLIELASALFATAIWFGGAVTIG